MPDTLYCHKMERIRRTCWIGKKIYYYDELESTNIMAKKLAKDGAPHGSLVIAEEQTAGRGRQGRQWVSPKGEGIWFTIILKPDIEPGKASMLTLVKAMAAVKGIERITGLMPQIKWPNDVVVEGKKICGILTEMSMQENSVNHIVIGTGINVHNRAFEEGLTDKATSLDIQLNRLAGNLKKTVKRLELLEAVLEEFEMYYEKYTRTMDLSLIMDEYHTYLANKNQKVLVHGHKVNHPQGITSHYNYEGLALGINKSGELLVDMGNRIEKIHSGEVSVRGIYGYV